jgi:hypothetical protein
MTVKNMVKMTVKKLHQRNDNFNKTDVDKYNYLKK